MKYLVLLLVIFPTISPAYFYPESYIESRDKFNSLAEELKLKHPNLITEALTLPTQTKAHLTIDTLYLPQNGKPDKLLILTSGIHGVEAFTGAAIQIEWLTQFFKKDWLDHMGVLVVHAVNPYGFHFERRVDEANIDLNRNMSASERHFFWYSLAYEKFEPYLNPKTQLKTGWWSDLKLFAQSIVKLITYGKKKITQIAVGGQYQNPKGIYFGGKEVRPNSKLLRTLFKKIGTSYDKILHIDLHTGYGERGTLHFFSSRDAIKLKGFDQLFSGYQIDSGSDDDFYKTSGNFDRFTMKVFKDKEIVIPMTFEFGTLDSQTILGGFYSLRNMIYENQAHHYGYADSSSEKQQKKDFLNMFNPSDKKWRDKVLRDGTETITRVVDRYQNL